MKRFVLALCLCCGQFVQADQSLTVIYDSGNTLPIAPYLPQRSEPQPKQSVLPTKRQSFQLPIETPSMSPGSVSATAKPLKYLQQPLFLIGADKQSKAWLKARHDQLVNLSAVGLLVQVDTLEEIKAIQALAKGLRLIPASAESFAKPLALKHYPVLISKDGWEQ
ncbi:integrating conjugative element protein (plasmid) [Maricurvus nonylphenolicus]|uniref:integrating conjugative element protein n=1 Tax=Maricurvus nonylphenolicus TaxID=1008307 RepID=UPI0036F32B60